ncbi:MAG TPA: D-glycerate dehydrogenase [Patescibacteria group bacterium]|nr:D-glycerate dehydrogenase [Patescibacteria group bacterium]
MTSIFVTREIPDEGLKMLKQDKRLKIEVYEGDKLIPRRELLRRVKGKDIILSMLTEEIDREVMDAAGPSLKMIANYAVGFDNIDLKEAAKRGIVVTNAAHPNVSETVAEHTVALIFALAHRIVEADHFTRQGKYKGWEPMSLLGTDVTGKTLGIIGAGNIGGMVARRMKEGFGLRIIYTSAHRNEAFEKEHNAIFKSQTQLLREADFVSLHVPLLPSTKHLIDDKSLGLMKKSAFLINTARGPVIDSAALVRALKKGKIAGAGIDVFEGEPQFARRKPDADYLQHAWNVILTPHTASATIETRQAMSRTAAENILAFVKGKTPSNLVK